MAISADTYDAFMFQNLKAAIDGQIFEKQRNEKNTNGILETALTNNIKNLQTMDIKEAAAVSNVVRSEVTPQMVAMMGAISGLRDLIRTAQPAS